MYDLAKDSYWREMIADWHSSGLSQAEFCRRHGMKRDNLSNWVRRLKVRDAESSHSSSASRPSRKRGATKPRPKSRNSQRPSNTPGPDDFVRVNLGERQSRLDSSTAVPDFIEVLYPNGVAVKLPAAMESRQLLTVLTALAKSPPHVL